MTTDELADLIHEAIKTNNPADVMKLLANFLGFHANLTGDFTVTNNEIGYHITVQGSKKQQFLEDRDLGLGDDHD